jgi:hypothetical protein
VLLCCRKLQSRQGTNLNMYCSVSSWLILCPVTNGRGRWQTHQGIFCFVGLSHQQITCWCSWEKKRNTHWWDRNRVYERIALGQAKVLIGTVHGIFYLAAVCDILKKLWRI